MAHQLHSHEKTARLDSKKIKFIATLLFCLVLIVYVIYSLISMIGGIATDVRIKPDLAANGGFTTAIVTDTSSEWHFRRTFRYELYFISYTFQPNNQTTAKQSTIQSRQEVSQTTFSTLTKGSTVSVKYLPTSPDTNMPVSELDNLTPHYKQQLFMTLFVIVLVVGGILTVTIGKRYMRKKHASKNNIAWFLVACLVLLVGGWFMALWLANILEAALL